MPVAIILLTSKLRKLKPLKVLVLLVLKIDFLNSPIVVSRSMTVALITCSCAPPVADAKKLVLFCIIALSENFSTVVLVVTLAKLEAALVIVPLFTEAVTAFHTFPALPKSVPLALT